MTIIVTVTLIRHRYKCIGPMEIVGNVKLNGDAIMIRE
jgi:hypothetical protein